MKDQNAIISYKIIEMAKTLLGENDKASFSSAPCSAVESELYRHLKTGGVYEVICNAAIESTGELSVVYRNTTTRERWIRPLSEFNDGRFGRIGYADAVPPPTHPWPIVDGSLVEMSKQNVPDQR